MAEPVPSVEIDGATWREGDVGIDARGHLVQVTRSEFDYSVPGSPMVPTLCFELMGSEEGGFKIGSEHDHVPRPIRKMRLVPVEESL